MACLIRSEERAGAVLEDEDRYGLTERLVDSLHTEAMVLTDEARAYFDDMGRAEREQLPAQDRVLFACESLKVTTRLMHVIAWLLSRRVMGVRDGTQPMQPLADPIASSEAEIAPLPPGAQHLIRATFDLQERVRRLEAEMLRGSIGGSPARSLLGQLERAL